MISLTGIIILLISYLIGAIPTSYIIVKSLKGIDIRSVGSKNVGATNAGRVLGKKWFFIITLIDILKGALPVLITKIIYNININSSNGWFLLIVGIFTIIGHTYPVYLRFKGGKGVAVTAGIFFVIDYRLIIGGLIVFLLVVLITRYISAASISASISLPIIELILYKNNPNYYLLGITILISIYVIYKHKSNIYRLIHHQERKWGERV